MKKVAIVADDYKLEKFKKELSKAGFNDYTIERFTASTSTIKISVQENQVKEVGKICQLVELHFKRGN